MSRFQVDVSDRLSLENVRYNIAPTQSAPVIVCMDGRRVLMDMCWSLVAPWAKNPKDNKYSTFNARDDKLELSKLYAPSFKAKRCIVPATGFYEWKNVNGVKQPYHFFMKKDYELFGMAGLWSHWISKTSDDEVFSFTIITTEPNDLLKGYHNRMPVILHEKDEARWLDPTIQHADKLKELLRPYPAEAMTCHAVARGALRPGNDGPMCIEPVIPGQPMP